MSTQKDWLILCGEKMDEGYRYNEMTNEDWYFAFLVAFITFGIYVVLVNA